MWQNTTKNIVHQKTRKLAGLQIAIAEVPSCHMPNSFQTMTKTLTRKILCDKLDPREYRQELDPWLLTMRIKFHSLGHSFWSKSGVSLLSTNGRNKKSLFQSNSLVQVRGLKYPTNTIVLVVDSNKSNRYRNIEILLITNNWDIYIR